MEAGDFRKTSIRGDSDGYKVKITGGPFRLYTDEWWDDEGFTGAMEAMTISRVGKVFLKVSDLDLNVRNFLGAGPKPRDTAMEERLFREDDRITGSGKADDLDGRSGNDWINGGSGNDRLGGGRGGDTLIGGSGRDSLNGGTGADRYVFNDVSDSPASRRAQDSVYFDSSDTIVLKPIDADTAARGNQAFEFVGDEAFSLKAGELRFGGSFLEGDVDGDGVSDFSINITPNGSLLALGGSARPDPPSARRRCPYSGRKNTFSPRLVRMAR
jgi:hypothetical protein